MTKRSLASTLAVTATVLAAIAILSGCTSSKVPEPTVVIAQETTETTVFYSTGRSVIAEQRVVDAKNVYADTLRVMLEAEPLSESNVAVVQPTAKVLSTTFKGGVVTVDWDKSVLGFDATDEEKRLARAAILMMYGQFREVKFVRFTVEGKEEGSIGGKDVEKFWGTVSLKGQPWKVVRYGAEAQSFDVTPTVEATPTPKKK